MRHLILCILLAVSLSLAYNRRPLMGNDEAAYQDMAAVGRPDLKGLWPPFFPFIGSIALRLGASNLWPVSLVSLILLIGLLWKMSSELELGALPFYFVALCPAVFAFGWNGMSDMLFTFLVTLSIWMFIRSETWWQGILAGMFTILSYETRYIGQFLLIWMAISILVDRTMKWRILAFATALAGILLSITINLWLYGFMSGERVPSQTSLVENVRQSGLAPWAVWFGDGPTFRYGFWPISIAGLAVLGWAFIAKKRWLYGLAAFCYLGMLIAVKMRIELEPIGRRYLLPIVPILILLNANRLGRWRYVALTGSIILALAHAYRGRVN